MRSLVWKLALAALTLALVAAPVPNTSKAWAASPALEAAQVLYDTAKYTEAIAKIRDALSSGELSGSDAIAARGLMARCLVKSGNRLEAKQAFKFVLRQQPGYHPDSRTVAPDEQEIFELAQREVTAEQIEAGKRIPASLSFNFGTGSGDNKDMGEIVKSFGGGDKYDVKPQFGGAVRFPVAQKWSLEFELQRLRAKATVPTGNPPPDDELIFEISGLPVSASVCYTAFSSQLLHVNVLAGGGVLATASSELQLGDVLSTGTSINLGGQKNGTYFHAGLEAEVFATRRLSLSARVLGRQAKASGVFDDAPFDFSDVSWKGRDIDFSGFAATLGLRAYIGY